MIMGMNMKSSDIVTFENNLSVTKESTDNTIYIYIYFFNDK